jgi:hypothetical protein
MKKEATWKNIPGTIYKVSSDGRIVNTKTNRVLSQRISKQGYYHVSFYVNGLLKTFRAHIIVSKAFIENPSFKKEVNHKDGNKLNNSVENLEWVTSRENKIHAVKNGLYKRSGDNARKLTPDQVEEIKSSTIGCYQAAKMYGVSHTTILRVRK